MVRKPHPKDFSDSTEHTLWSLKPRPKANSIEKGPELWQPLYQHQKRNPASTVLDTEAWGRMNAWEIQGWHHRFQYSLIQGLGLEPLYFCDHHQFWLLFLSAIFIDACTEHSKQQIYCLLGRSTPHHKFTNWLSATDECHVCSRAFLIFPELLTTEADRGDLSPVKCTSTKLPEGPELIRKFPKKDSIWGQGGEERSKFLGFLSSSHPWPLIPAAETVIDLPALSSFTGLAVRPRKNQVMKDDLVFKILSNQSHTNEIRSPRLSNNSQPKPSRICMLILANISFQSFRET